LKAASVAVVLLLLFAQSAVAFNLVAAEQSKPKLNAYLKANQCAIAAPQSQTQTTSATTAPVPFLDFPAILIAILLGFFIVARRRRSSP
jgi:hypothetical protein